jgi:hypothetical protein
MIASTLRYRFNIEKPEYLFLIKMSYCKLEIDVFNLKRIQPIPQTYMSLSCSPPLSMGQISEIQKMTIVCCTHIL